MAKLSPDNHLSGSTVPAWLNLSPWDSPFDVLQRARDSLEGKPRPELDSLQVDIGNALELPLLTRACRVLGLDELELYHHHEGIDLAAKRHPRMDLYYSDDGLMIMPQPVTVRTDPAANITVHNELGEIELHGKLVFECKFTTAGRKPDDPQLHRGPVQLQVGMMCHEAQAGILVTCYSGRDLVIDIFEPHQATRQQITEAVVSFEDHMANGTWPEPAELRDFVKAWPEAGPDEPPVDLDDAAIDAARRIQAATEAIKNFEDDRAQSYTTIMEQLRENKYGEGVAADGTRIRATWGWRKSSAKPAQLCPSCLHELEPAKPESSARSKTISIKEMK